MPIKRVNYLQRVITLHKQETMELVFTHHLFWYYFAGLIFQSYGSVIFHFVIHNGHVNFSSPVYLDINVVASR